MEDEQFTTVETSPWRALQGTAADLMKAFETFRREERELEAKRT